MSTNKRFYINSDCGIPGFVLIEDREAFLTACVRVESEYVSYQQELCDLLNKGWEATEEER